MKMKLFLAAVAVAILNGCGGSTAYVKIDKSKYSLNECKTTRYTGVDPDSVERIDRIVVYKGKRTLYTYRNGEVVDSFRISLGKNADRGHKVMKGDYKTPEGIYSVAYKQFSTSYYKSLKISYPNARDRAVARSKGVSPGGLIMIHGQPHWNARGLADSYTLKQDWTAGCIAVSNRAMDRLFYAVESGVRVEIYA